MRQIVLDTETTGLEPSDHRIIEIGCVELVHRRATGNHLHLYVNPERTVEQGAIEVHGITNEFLADKPRFAAIADELQAYLGDAELVIHNAPFDLGFLDAEFRRLQPEFPGLQSQVSVLDTLVEARRLHPGQRNSLDALCKRYGVDDSARERHGALLDAELLADVYLFMSGGQTAISFAVENAEQSHQHHADVAAILAAAPNRPRVVAASDEERTAHDEYLQRLSEASGDRCLWHSLDRA